MRKPLVIAVDGTAASGKGTLARALAAHYQLPYMDTGKLYRAFAWQFLHAGMVAETLSAEQAADIANAITNDLLASPALMSDTISAQTSILSANPLVRQALFDLQRHFATAPTGAVLDGRDIGTVIAPDAPVKFFITASAEVRAERRYRELVQQDPATSLAAVLQALKERDDRDRSRTNAPMTQASDAIAIDTSTMTVAEVMAEALQDVERLRLNRF
jgi:cytidylate kinase